MLGLILMMVFGSPGVRAQDFYQSNSEYNIKQFQVPFGSQFSTTDPFIDLTMECLAANGYGQWTMSSNTGSFNFSTHTPLWLINPDPLYDHGAGWFLMGNLLAKPSEKVDHSNITQHPGCQPPGIISGGHFNSAATNPKAIANLNGQVRYVWVESVARTTFIMQGLNDAFTSSSPQIDISLTGIPNPEINTQIVKAAISSLTAAGTNDGTGNKAVTTAGDWRDQFDIACDKAFIYIVWTHVNGAQNEVYATAVDINTGLSGTALPPFKVDGNGTTNFNNPTVACDVRYDGANGPQFDVAYISRTTSGNGTVIVKSFLNSAVPVKSETLVGASKKFHDPFSSSTPDHAYFNATHARILVSSISQSSTLTHCVYVIEGDDIILYKPLAFAGDIANYIDGVFANNPTPKPFPVPMVQTSGVNGIVDKYIVAYANPYDNQTGTYNQFHCLYQLAVSSPTMNPLILIRGNDNGFGNPVTTDTRLLLNQDFAGIQADPTSYVAAINQMGGHIHWFSGTSPITHFYARDRRYFDEPIEENTLATNDCYIADGSSTGFNHGGTVGAAVVNSKTLTVWTDMNYGAVTGSTTSGIYLDWPYDASVTDPKFLFGWNLGSLSFGYNVFNSNTLTLTIGENPPIESATFVTVPVCGFGLWGFGCFPVIQVDPTSTWHSYQSPVFPNGGGVPVNIGLSGASSAANLIIHGGANFASFPIAGNVGAIDIKFEADIFPQNLSTTTNSGASGLLTIFDENTLDHCTVTSHIPSGSATVVVQIDGTVGSTPDTRTTLSSTTTDYTNSGSSSGVGIIQYNHTANGCKSPDKVIFNAGNITRDRIHAIDPIADFTIENMTLDQISDKEIFIERSSCTDANNDPYGNITINSNIFATTAGLGSVADQFGIYIKNFSLSTDFPHLNVNSNNFTGTANASGNMQAAIALENSTGNVENNTITDDGYIIGIDILGSGTTVPIAKSYLCNNTISGLAGGGPTFADGLGIKVDNYKGYIKLCTISSCTMGLVAGDAGNPMLAFTSITNCSDEGIHTSLSTAEVDLSGVHGATSGGDDYSAPNTIKHNGTTMTTPTQVALTPTSLIDYGTTFELFTWTDWGRNNTEGSTGDTYIITSVTTPVTAWTINDINNNFWEIGTSVKDPSSSSANFRDITYNCTTHLTAEQTFSGVSCSGGYSAHGKDVRPQSVQIDTSTECSKLLPWAHYSPQSQSEYIQQYDSARKYIELCASQQGSFHAFSAILGACQYSAPDDTTRFDRLRDWCKSVLYLNTTEPEYFCADMLSIAKTYLYGKWKIPNAALAIFEYLENNPNCSGQGLVDEINNNIRSRHDSWLTLYNDGDTSAKEDTTLPSMAQLGLDSLLKLHGTAAVSTPTTLAPTYLSSFTSSPNPFVTETSLRFTLNRLAYITVIIYDELGRPVYGDGTGRTFDPGEHIINFNASMLPGGTYYARISTGFGEVQTLKLVHEK